MEKTENELFIAHIRESDHAVQTVLEHNQGVAKLARIAGEPYGMANLAECAGLHHDDGKNRTEFKSYLLNAIAGKKQKRGSVIHSTHGACIVDQLINNSNKYSQFAAEIIRNAIMSHHGIRDALTIDGIISYEKATKKIVGSLRSVSEQVYKDFGEEKLKKNIQEMIAEVEIIVKKVETFNQSVRRFGSSHFYYGMYQRLLMSILIDADRTDTSCFFDGTIPLLRMSKDNLTNQWKKYLDTVNTKIEMLEKTKTPSPLDQFRSEISRKCANFDGGEKGVFRLVVPCGAGKTISSLRYALQTAARYGKQHIFYIAPFNSILEQNADVIGEMIGDVGAVLQHHSNIVFEMENEEDEKSEEKRYKLLTDNWLLSPIIATSAVQFLNALFLAKTTSVRKMQSLGNSVIIIDEIQALPIKVMKLFNGAMNFLSEFCNSVVVLCSATQPTLEELDSYCICNPRDILPDYKKYTGAFKRIEIECPELGKALNYGEAADFVLEKICEVDSLLMIVNTKSAAMKIVLELESKVEQSSDYTIVHLSTNMCPEHRRSVILGLKQQLRQKNKKKKIICVSTALIEAGVDISFDLVIRSLTGLDSVIQAGGRCNRNQESALGKVFVVELQNEDVRKLGDLVLKQRIMRDIFSIYEKERKANPSKYHDGLLEENIIKYYYKKYYNMSKRQMEFFLDYDSETSILDLLSENESGRSKNEMSDLIFEQAFQKAGEEFKVIDESGGIDVVVEYNLDAENHIQHLKESKKLSDIRRELRYLQRYTVQLKANIDDLYRSGAEYNSEFGVYFLSKISYDCTFGITVNSLLVG